MDRKLFDFNGIAPGLPTAKKAVKESMPGSTEDLASRPAREILHFHDRHFADLDQ